MGNYDFLKKGVPYNKEELTITESSKSYLLEIAKWTRFFAILGYVMLGLTVLMGITFMFLGGLIPGKMGFSPVFSGLWIIVFSVMYFFPVQYLYKFSKKIKSGLESINSEEVAEAFKNLKSHYKFVGILTIVAISLYLLTLIIVVISSAVMFS
jgi:hypothetical protein